MARVFCLLSVLIGLAASPVEAQIASEGSIRGVVRDAQGSVLPDVAITATSPTVAGARTAVSDDQGAYRLLDLPPGEYTVAAERQGFSKVSRT